MPDAVLEGLVVLGHVPGQGLGADGKVNAGPLCASSRTTSRERRSYINTVCVVPDNKQREEELYKHCVRRQGQQAERGGVTQTQKRLTGREEELYKHRRE